MAGCPEMTAAIAGSVCGTLVVCTSVFGVILYCMWRKMRRTSLKYSVRARNGVDRHQSMLGSVEGGLHNSAYVGDNSESNDVIMMMATKQNGDEKKLNTPRKRIVPSIYKHLDQVEVSLIGKEVSGLGFDVQGNPRDGISISNIADRGAAKETNQMKVGDKVISLTICFDNMVYEDALTLLSYASPYPITVQLGRKRKEKSKDSGTLKSTGTARRKQSSYDSDSGTVSGARSPGLSDRHSTGCQEEADSTLPSVATDTDIEIPSGDVHVEDVGYEEQASDEEGDTDDDTRKRAPSHLPQTIKSLVESKNAGRQAVEVIEDHTRNQILSPTSLESDQGIELSFGAQSALDLILNQSTEISTTS